LERECRSRKQVFGIDIYDLMDSLDKDSELSEEEKQGRIKIAFDRARKDIAVIQAKIDCKQDEMASLDMNQASANTTMSDPSDNIPPSTGTIMSE
jgi:hypothetical protein